jgi:DNA-binding XRE family transcriptional regulator
VTGAGADLVSDAESIAAMWRDLGHQLAALRRGAGLTQHALAALIRFSRTTVSLAEIGRTEQSREFWDACDKALCTGGVLAAGAAQVGAARKAQQHAAACAAQETREARALAAFATARDQHEVSAGVSAVQPCPNCGCEVTILTTLIPGNAAGARLRLNQEGWLSEYRPQAPARAGSGLVPARAGSTETVTEEGRPKAIRTT